MKQTFLLIVVLASYLSSFAQYDGTKQKIATKETPKTLAAPNQTVKTIPEEKLPDLTVVSLSVQYNNDQIVNGVTKHLITVSYAIKNDGAGSVLANKVAWQGYITYDTNNPQLLAAGGTQISNSSTAVINPGATVQGSFRVTVDFDKGRHPLYTLYLDNYNDVKESNEVNNIAQKAITF